MALEFSLKTLPFASCGFQGFCERMYLPLGSRFGASRSGATEGAIGSVGYMLNPQSKEVDVLSKEYVEVAGNEVFRFSDRWMA